MSEMTLKPNEKLDVSPLRSVWPRRRPWRSASGWVWITLR